MKEIVKQSVFDPVAHKGCHVTYSQRIKRLIKSILTCVHNKVKNQEKKSMCKKTIWQIVHSNEMSIKI